MILQSIPLNEESNNKNYCRFMQISRLFSSIHNSDIAANYLVENQPKKYQRKGEKT